MSQKRKRKPGEEGGHAEAEEDDDRISPHLAPSLNVTAQLHRQMRVRAGSSGEVPRITALALAGAGGSKYVLAGDDEGQVSVFLRNGTLRGKVDTNAEGAAASSVDSLASQASSVLFHTGGDWGFVEVEKLRVQRPDCPRRGGSFSAVTLDSQLATRVLAADADGMVWVYNVGKKDKECILEMRYAQGAPRGLADLISVAGFVIGLERSGGPGESVSAVALNMSQVTRGKGVNRFPEVIPPKQAAIVWRRERPPVRAWSVQRRVKEGDLMAFLSEDGHEIEIVELLMQSYAAPPMESPFGSFQMPVIGVAVLLVLGYQYIKQKSKIGKKK